MCQFIPLSKWQAFCFLAFILFFVLVVWMVIFAAMKWNNEVVKYTLKDGIAVL